VLLSSGSYTVEPCFANLLREAVDLGYQIFPYEAGPNDFGKYREIVQAENIKKVLDQHPDSKLFIYCGYDHAVEDSLSHDWLLAMAGRLKQITGIDPLTIDQVELSERIPASGENAYRHSMSASYSAVWVDKDGKVFNQANENKYYDLNIYHPNTELINGRPKWRYTSATRAVRCSGIDQFPTLVLAYRESEDITQAVPVDVVEIREKGANVPLLLPTGKYTVVYRAVDGTEKVWKKQVH